MNICYNTKHISKLSWLLNSFSPSHLRVSVDEGKANSSVLRTVINLRQPCRVPLRLSCYGSQIRCVWVSWSLRRTLELKFPGASVYLSRAEPFGTLRGEKGLRFFILNVALLTRTLLRVSDTKSVFFVEILFVEHQMVCCIDWQS